MSKSSKEILPESELERELEDIREMGLDQKDPD